MSSLVDAVAQADQYLTFRLAGEEFAVGILRVKEIIQYGVVTRVPSAPQWIRGVMNLRGSVVPVVDLAVKFGLPESEISKWSCVVIVELEAHGEPLVMGILADTVRQVLDLTAGDIEPPPTFGTRVQLEYLLGMARLGPKFALILDLDRILSSDDLAGLHLDGAGAPA